jgi:hypothetical protein
MEYLILTEQFCEENQGHSEGVNCFGYAKTGDGRFVTPKQAEKDLPKLFSGHKFTKVELEIADFKPDYTKTDVKVDQKFFVVERIENYLEKTITVVYSLNGELKKIAKEITDETATKTGYTSDMEVIIKEIESIKLEEPITKL